MIRRIKKAILDIGDKNGLRTVIVCAGCLAAVLGTAASAGPAASADTEASAETEEKYEAPQILCPEADGAEGWYQTAPAVRIIHTEHRTVTRYMRASCGWKRKKIRKKRMRRAKKGRAQKERTRRSRKAGGRETRNRRNRPRKIRMRKIRDQKRAKKRRQ